MPITAPPERAALSTRRHLLSAAGGLGALLALRPTTAAAPAARQASDGGEAPLFRLSLAEWSLHRTLRSGELDNLDFAPFAKQRFGIEAVEYVNSFFKDRACDFRYLRELKRRAEDAGVRQNLVMCDGEGYLGDASEKRRASAVENHFRWIAATAFLGGYAIRVNAHGEGPPEEVARRVADSLHHLAEFAEPYGIDVIVENHGGYSSNGAWLAGVIRAAGHPRVGTLPDFGNFRLGDGTEYDRYRGVAEMMPFARAVSAKSYAFDERGEETTIDYERMLRIVLDAGYHGWIGIEYEGSRHSEIEGIRLTRELLLRLRKRLASER